MPRRKKFEWTEANIKLLGTMTDEKLAEKLGTTLYQVWLRRSIEQIPPKRTDSQPSEEVAAALGKVPDSVLARRYGLRYAVVRGWRLRLNVPGVQKEKRPLEFESLLGVESDARIAETYGLTRQYVHQCRLVRCIPPKKRGSKLQVGQRIGDATVQAVFSGGFADIRCSCGDVRRVGVYNLNNRVSGLCRACRSRRIAEKYAGKKYGRLTALRPVDQTKAGAHNRWLLDCDCGTRSHEAILGNVIAGKSTSCGCHQREAVMAAVKRRWSRPAVV